MSPQHPGTPKMTVFTFEQVQDNLEYNKPGRSYPGQSDVRHADQALWPHWVPGFTIDREARPSIFTIGSCFARNIEDALQPLGIEVPTLQWVTRPEERQPDLPGSPRGLLNEYNPATMAQRVLCTLEDREYPEDTICPSTLSGPLTFDLLLAAQNDIPRERAIARRRELADLYAHLRTSPYAIITLGLVEAWFDNETAFYLNRMPPYLVMKKQPRRYSLHILSADRCYELLAPAIAALQARQVKVLLSVSPVPLMHTFARVDAVVANESSKAALRVCADRLCRDFPAVDYFPSYEIVRSGGLVNYDDDNVHPRQELIRRITQFMVDRYCSTPDLARTA